MKPILETPRLFLREFIIEDAKEFFLLNNDPEVIKYTGDDPFNHVDAAAQFLKNYEYKIPHQSNKKFRIGRWAMVDKINSEFIGWCGLKFVEEINEVNLGYRLHKRFWGMHYATESSKASLDFGFNQLEIPVIVARAMKANVASIQVMKNCGMTYWKESHFHKHDGVCYRSFNPNITEKTK